MDHVTTVYMYHIRPIRSHLKDDVVGKSVFDAADNILCLALGQLNRLVSRFEQRTKSRKLGNSTKLL